MSTPPFAQILLRKEPAYRRSAFVDGLKRLGYTIPDGRSALLHPRGPDDLLVIWNKKAGRDEEDANTWERRGGTVIVTENAYLQKVDKSSYAISTHGHNGSGWFPFVPGDERFAKLGYEIKEARPGHGKHIVCGQRGIGSKLMASPVQWGEKKVKELHRDGIKARLRAHPGNFAPKVPLLKDLEGIDTCHIWSSSAGIVALLEGLIVYHDAPHWVCSAWQDFGVENAMKHMAHGQWSVAEIETGEPFARMKAEGWGPRKWD